MRTERLSIRLKADVCANTTELWGKLLLFVLFCFVRETVENRLTHSLPEGGLRICSAVLLSKANTKLINHSLNWVLFSSKVVNKSVIIGHVYNISKEGIKVWHKINMFKIWASFCICRWTRQCCDGKQTSSCWKFIVYLMLSYLTSFKVYSSLKKFPIILFL